jgi:hypothetical protein
MVSETTPMVLAEGYKHTMALDQSALLEVPGGDPARRDADRLGRLGRVLGQVRRDGDIGDLPAAGEADDSGIDLVAPGDVSAVRLHRMRDGGEPSLFCHLADEHPARQQEAGKTTLRSARRTVSQRRCTLLSCQGSGRSS